MYRKTTSTKSKRKNHRRLSSFSYMLLTLIFLTALLLCGPWGNDKAEAQTTDGFAPMTEVVVRSGDSLWQLVAENCQYQGDIRQAIYEVKKINGLKGSDIYPGQVLYMPADCF
ncbi:MAG: LysM peptidoglycan-binding domain-containing protein [Firmicutes bacterium]|nr:LysM peptidoglycan-binding domain-containing protein [Bacillota bacterium]